MWTKRRRDVKPVPLDLPSDRRIVLHVGCGPAHIGHLPPRFRGPDWHELRLDIDPSVEPDIVASITDLSAVRSESVDGVWSSHNLEHVFAHEVPVVLRGFLRVLRPGGVLGLAVPDLQVIGRAIASGDLEKSVYESPGGPIAPLDMLYGHRESVRQGNEFMAHRTGFAAKTLRDKLTEVGFVDVDVQRRDRELVAQARKPAA